MAAGRRPGEGGDVSAQRHSGDVAKQRIQRNGIPPVCYFGPSRNSTPLSRDIPHERSPATAAPPRSENPPRRVTVTTSWLALRSRDADGRDRLVSQLLRGIALRQQRDAEAGFDQALLRGQAVDRRPVDFTEPVGLKQRKHMRRRDLAPSPAPREMRSSVRRADRRVLPHGGRRADGRARTPPATVRQTAIRNRDRASGRGHSAGRWSPRRAGSVADLRAGRGAQAQFDLGVFGREALQDRRQPPAGKRADHRERNRP